MDANILISTMLCLMMVSGCVAKENNQNDSTEEINGVFARIRSHNFNPLNDDQSMTKDHQLGVDGIADLNNKDWLVRLLAVRDLLKTGYVSPNELLTGLKDTSLHVRYLTAMALGILRAKEAIPELEVLLQYDSITLVRSQAAIALGQMESTPSLGILNKTLTEDPSRDVRHQCELAIYQIEHKSGVTEKLREAYLGLDEFTFKILKEGDVAPDFTLEDTDGKEWKLSAQGDRNWVVLIWVFADWCPVCHGEFHDLMEMEETLDSLGVQVFTLETHDTYRGRVMVGKELEPEYWFSKTPFKEAYTSRIFWPHLLDRAGAYGAKFGIDPMAFAVHAEYINRPATVILDAEGKVRFSYMGTFWGDRPSIAQTLKMIETESFTFEHPQRRKIGQ